MSEFLKANQQLNYAYNNPKESALAGYTIAILKKTDPKKLQDLVPSLDIIATPGLLSSKQSYKGVPETAALCLTEINNYTNNMSKASMR